MSGYPKPEIIWTLQGRRIDSSRFQKIETDQGGRLRIIAANAEDAGELRCSTRNYLGSDYSAKVLSVTGNLHMEPCQTFIMDVCRKNSCQLKDVNYFRKKSSIIDV